MWVRFVQYRRRAVSCASSTGKLAVRASFRRWRGVSVSSIQSNVNEIEAQRTFQDAIKMKHEREIQASTVDRVRRTVICMLASNVSCLDKTAVCGNAEQEI